MPSLENQPQKCHPTDAAREGGDDGKAGARVLNSQTRHKMSEMISYRLAFP